MAITYTWNVKTVDTKTVDGNADTVFNVHYILTGTDENENSETAYGTIALDTSDLSDFTAFADLTASTVQSWTEAALGEEEVQVLKDVIAFKIAEKISPTEQRKTIGE